MEGALNETTKKMTKKKPVDMDLLRADIFLLNSVEQLSKSSLGN